MPQSRPVMLVRSGGAAALPGWQSAFARLLPDLDVRGWDDAAVDPASVEYVLVWEPEPGRIAGFPNLRAVFSSAAGVDHITRDPTLPPHLPIVRMAADEMAQTVGEYVTMAALMVLRDAPRMMRGHATGTWDHFNPGRTAHQATVGILGLGWIGQHAAAMLRGVGFPVRGWTRTPRAAEGVAGFAGPAQLDDFLSGTDILVAILPDTADTRGLLDARRLAALPHGAAIVNAGRGTLAVVPDLLAALDSGHLSMAVLDVFETEPLPADSPLWRHERVLATSHIAGFASRPARAESVARGIAALQEGRTPDNLYQPGRGY